MKSRRQSCIKWSASGFEDYVPGLPDDDPRSYKSAELVVQAARAATLSNPHAEFEAHVSSRRRSLSLATRTAGVVMAQPAEAEVEPMALAVEAAE